MFASVFITVKSIQQEVRDHQFTVSDILKNQIFYTLIISLASTYLLWFVVSFLFFDPWHMFTSFLQYLLLTPTYINILNVYAFCNTHDITWGTKGDDKAEKLPSATLKPGGKVDVNIPTDDGDLNAQYEAEMRKIVSKAPPEKRVHSACRNARRLLQVFQIVRRYLLAGVQLCSRGRRPQHRWSRACGYEHKRNEQERYLPGRRPLVRCRPLGIQVHRRYVVPDRQNV